MIGRKPSRSPAWLRRARRHASRSAERLAPLPISTPKSVRVTTPSDGAVASPGLRSRGALSAGVGVSAGLDVAGPMDTRGGKTGAGLTGAGAFRGATDRAGHVLEIPLQHRDACEQPVAIRRQRAQRLGHSAKICFGIVGSHQRCFRRRTHGCRGGRGTERRATYAGIRTRKPSRMTAISNASTAPAPQRPSRASVPISN